MRVTPRVHVLDDDHCVASWRDVVIVVVKRQANPEALRAGPSLRDRLGKAGLLVVIARSSGFPSPEFRAALEAAIRAPLSGSRVEATVYEGRRPGAAMDSPRLFGSLAAAAAWVAPRLGDDVPPRELLEATAEVLDQAGLESAAPRPVPAV